MINIQIGQIYQNLSTDEFFKVVEINSHSIIMRELDTIFDQDPYVQHTLFSLEIEIVHGRYKRVKTNVEDFVDSL